MLVACSVHGRGRKLDKAVEMFKEACNLNVSLDEKAYANMISLYGKAGKSILNNFFSSFVSS